MQENNIVLVSGKHSDWFLEAVFVVKDKKLLPKDLLKEAEVIIEAYLYNKGLVEKPTETYVMASKPEKIEAVTPSVSSVRLQSRQRKNPLEVAFLYFGLISICMMVGFLVRGIYGA